MADADPHAPWHEPAMPVLDEEAVWVHEAAARFEHATASELLTWALEQFHPNGDQRRGRGGRHGPDRHGVAHRSVGACVHAGHRPPSAETYSLFEGVRDRYGIAVEFDTPTRPRSPPGEREGQT